MKHLLSTTIFLFWLSISVCNSAIKPFRFAQITDIHLSPTGKSAEKDLCHTIRHINAMDSIDFVLVTGDLTGQGDRATLLRARHILDSLQMPYHVCLGNHETTWSESGCTAFSEIFGKETYAFEHNGVCFLTFNSGPLMRMAYGHVSPKDIAWVQAELTHSKQKGMPTILVTHYPILPSDLDNWYEVTDAVRHTGNVRLFIGGHYHDVRLLHYDGIPGILMRSNLHDEKGLSGFGIYEVSPREINAYVANYDRHVKDENIQLQKVATYPMDSCTYNPSAHAEIYPDTSCNSNYPQVKETWINATDGAFYCSPVIEHQRIFIGDNEGRLRAFSFRDGHQLWEYQTGARIIGGPAVESGIVVCGSADGYIYGIKAANGSLKWKVKAHGPVLGYTIIRKGIAYIGASDSTFRAINIKTGKVILEYKNLKGYVVTRPLVTRDKVVFGAWDNTLYALSPHDGHELWKWTGNIRGMLFSPAQVWPIEAQGKVFISDPERALTAIDSHTGETIWRTKQSKVRETIGLSKDHKRLYSKTMQDSLVCYSTTTDTPKELWACNVGFGYEHGPSMPMEKNGIVYETTKEGLIFAVEAKTGRLIWKHRVGNSLMSTPLPLSRRRVLFSSTDGRIGLLTIK